MEYLGEIGQHIFIRLTDRDLSALIVASTSLEAMINTQSQLFWYERARSLIGKLDLQKREGANWKTICSDLTSDKPGYVRGAFHLDTMKVLLEAYPTEEIGDEEVVKIRSWEVLEYVLDLGEKQRDRLATSQAGLSSLQTIVQDTMRKYPTEAVLMVDVLEKRGYNVGRAAATAALFYGQIDAFRNLIRTRYALAADDMVNFKAAIDGENVTSLQFMKEHLTKHQFGTLSDALLNYAIRGGRQR